MAGFYESPSVVTFIMFVTTSGDITMSKLAYVRDHGSLLVMLWLWKNIGDADNHSNLLDMVSTALYPAISSLRSGFEFRPAAGEEFSDIKILLLD